jgi:hypothetical protein
MAPPRKYQPGDRINHWTVLAFEKGVPAYRMQCDCGTIRQIRAGNHCISCGCQMGRLLKISYAEKRSRGIHHPSRTHGLSQTREYRSYKHMINRCHNPKNDSYHLYGARGILVCDRWRGKNGFDNFLADMGPRPKGTSLDRINVDGGYSPDNCRWADAKTQIANRRYVVQISLARLQKLEAFAASMGMKI